MAIGCINKIYFQCLTENINKVTSSDLDLSLFSHFLIYQRFWTKSSERNFILYV